MKINLGREFARYPAGRYLSDGPHSGQRFREDFLIRALATPNEPIEINLDEARGLKSSFLEEAFGGLVRKGFSADQLMKRLSFISRDPSLIEEIFGYIQAQQKRQDS